MDSLTVAYSPEDMMSIVYDLKKWIWDYENIKMP